MSFNFPVRFAFAAEARLLLALALYGAASAGAQTDPPQTVPPQTEQAPSKASAADPVVHVDPQRAQQAYLNGARLMDHNDLEGAQREFARAAALDPTHNDYATALTLTREHRVSELIQQAAKARLQSKSDEADKLIAEARSIDPENELVLQHADAAQAAAPRVVAKPGIGYTTAIELQPTAGPQDLHLRGDGRQVVTKAGLAYGIRVTYFDTATAADNASVRFDLDQTPYTEAMPILLRMTHLFGVPVDAKTLLVAKDTEENRQKLERQSEETLYIPASTKDEMSEYTNIIKNVFDVKQIATSADSGTIAIRAPAATLKALNYTLADMIDGGAEVELQLKLVTVDKSVTRNLGASPPTSGSAFSAAGEVQSFVSANQSTISSAISSGALVPSGSNAQQLVEEAAFLILSGLATDAKLTNVISFFGHGLTLFGASIGGGGALNFGLNTSAARALDDITVRIGDGQTTTLRVGEKYPVTTATYGSGVSSSTASALQGVTVNGVSASSLLNQYLGSASSAIVPQVQYEDLGITLKTKPVVLRSGLVRLSIDMKIEALTGASLNNIPVLTSSVYTSDITVPDGQTVVMLSDMSSTESAAISGLPGIGELPGFQQTLSDTMKTTDSSELILLITPHLVRHRSASMASRAIPFRTSVPADN
jgi:general secretion pathway protein D